MTEQPLMSVQEPPEEAGRANLQTFLILLAILVIVGAFVAYVAQTLGKPATSAAPEIDLESLAMPAGEPANEPAPVTAPEEPVAADPDADAPAVNEPTTDAPAADEPAADAPASE